MSDEDIRSTVKILQEKKTSPQRRRSDAVRTSKKLSGKSKEIAIDDFS